MLNDLGYNQNWQYLSKIAFRASVFDYVILEQIRSPKVCRVVFPSLKVPWWFFIPQPKIPWKHYIFQDSHHVFAFKYLVALFSVVYPIHYNDQKIVIHPFLHSNQCLTVQALRPDRLQSAMSFFCSKALGKLNIHKHDFCI